MDVLNLGISFPARIIKTAGAEKPFSSWTRLEIDVISKLLLSKSLELAC